MSKFNPNVSTFEDGVQRVKQALQETGFEVSNQVITSQDKGVNKVLNLLAGDNVPEGFKKWQLPFIFEKGQFFISVAQPDIYVPKHSHDSGDGIRFIVSGSVYYEDKELRAGDWMYIPQGAPYEMKVGNYGATMAYCYACCCVPKRLNTGADVIHTNPFS